MRGHYTLKGHEAVPVDDLLTWAKQLESQDRIVARKTIWPFMVSTVFLGLDHQWGDGLPLLFETMVFCRFTGMSGTLCERCSTWDEAEEQHRQVVALVSSPYWYVSALFCAAREGVKELWRKWK